MAQKIRQQQITPNVIKILKAKVNNGTGSRSTTTSSSQTALACTGDTSYTAPSDMNVDILFTMSQMTTRNAGQTRMWLGINGVAQLPGTYQTDLNWSTATIPYKVQVNAGATITINCLWSQEGGGTGTITNASTDTSFPNEILGIVIPRTV